MVIILVSLNFDFLPWLHPGSPSFLRLYLHSIPVSYYLCFFLKRRLKMRSWRHFLYKLFNYVNQNPATLNYRSHQLLLWYLSCLPNSCQHLWLWTFHHYSIDFNFDCYHFHVHLLIQCLATVSFELIGLFPLKTLSCDSFSLVFSTFSVLRFKSFS
jgi:hypothetical protein